MEQRTVTTVGSGTAQATPDAVVAVLLVEVEGTTPAEALTGCGAVQAGMLAALGVPAAAGGLSVQPAWDHERQRPGKPVASSRVSVQLPDLAAAGDVVTAALAAGGRAARLESLRPVVTDPTSALREARQLAFEAARDAAVHYATLAGGALGACLAIAEGSQHTVPVGRKAIVLESSGFDVADGTQPVVATVTATWELAD